MGRGLFLIDYPHVLVLFAPAAAVCCMHRPRGVRVLLLGGCGLVRGLGLLPGRWSLACAVVDKSRVLCKLSMCGGLGIGDLEIQRWDDGCSAGNGGRGAPGKHQCGQLLPFHLRLRAISSMSGIILVSRIYFGRKLRRFEMQTPLQRSYVVYIVPVLSPPSTFQ